MQKRSAIMWWFRGMAIFAPGPRGLTMLRKQIIKATPANPVPAPGEIDIAAVATVQVTSEAPDHPIDFAFDPHRGSGAIAGSQGSRVSRP